MFFCLGCGHEVNAMHNDNTVMKLSEIQALTKPCLLLCTHCGMPMELKDGKIERASRELAVYIGSNDPITAIALMATIIQCHHDWHKRGCPRQPIRNN